MCNLEKNSDTAMMADDVQLDETAVDVSHKSLATEELYKELVKAKRGLSRQLGCIFSGVDSNGNAFARAFNVGQMSPQGALGIAPHIEDRCRIMTDKTVASNKLVFQKQAFHSMMKDRYRAMHGWETRHINRYATFLAYMWQFKKMDENAKYDEALEIVMENRFSIPISMLQEYRIFNPDDIEWRAA